MAKKDNTQEATASQVENTKLHGDDAPSTQARELRDEERSVLPRVVSDEELAAIEEAASEPTIPTVEQEDGPILVPDLSGLAAASAPSRDSRDYVYRDVLGTTIVGYQEQVPRSEVEGE